jgi:glucan biosynthesis protein C
MSQRSYWLDWLRVLAMGTIFLYHSGRPFITIAWHIMNPEPDLLFSLVNAFVTGWIMPLFFVISGIATYFSLAKRSPVQFAKDRFKRLMIPFLLPGLLLVLPVHVYYDKVFHGSFVGGFIDFYLGPYLGLKVFPFDLNFSTTYFADSNQGVYLWYIFWLFVFSLVTVHLFKWLAEGGNRSKISKLAAVCDRRGGIFLLAIPLIIVNIIAVPPFFVFPSGYGGWKLPTYLAFFIIAYVLACDPKFMEAIHKNRILTLLVGAITSVCILILLVTLGVGGIASAAPLDYVMVSTVWALNGWCWVIAILGFGRKLLSFNQRSLEISNELVLPFYILHQTVIVAVAFYVVSLNLIVIEKYLIIVLASFTIISALLLPIREINLLRFLFGMRPKKE